jgi:hypothetical protein
VERAGLLNFEPPPRTAPVGMFAAGEHVVAMKQNGNRLDEPNKNSCRVMGA